MSFSFSVYFRWQALVNQHLWNLQDLGRFGGGPIFLTAAKRLQDSQDLLYASWNVFTLALLLATFNRGSQRETIHFEGGPVFLVAANHLRNHSAPFLMCRGCTSAALVSCSCTFPGKHTSPQIAQSTETWTYQTVHHPTCGIKNSERSPPPAYGQKRKEN
jgi:hypothetical protein